MISAAGELDPGDDNDGFEGLDLCVYVFASGTTLLGMWLFDGKEVEGREHCSENGECEDGLGSGSG